MTIQLTGKKIITIVQTALLVVIAGLLLWMQPWDNSNAGDGSRKITVTGESVIEAEPDEYSFNPTFERTGTDQEVLKDQLTTEANQVITKLKELGVAEKDIKLDVSSYDNWYVAAGEEGMLNAYVQIKTLDKDLAQKIQDYLLSTSAKGQLTPQASFSETKQDELEALAVEMAIDDAKAKAELQAKKFDSTVGKVIEVAQSQDVMFPVAYASDSVMTMEAGPERASLPIMSGQNEYKQTVTVTYELQ